jgi:hypothetical protein
MSEIAYQKFITDSFSVFKDSDSIVTDGPIDFNKWEKQKIKLLFYYKETYGYDDFGGTSISEHYKEWILDNIPTYKKMGMLAYLLIETTNSGKIFEYDETFLKDLYQNHNLLIDCLSNTSILNINKLSIAENKTSDSVIREKSRENKIILKTQIEILEPTVIICGGRVTSDSLFLDINYLGRKNYEFEVAEIIDNKIIAPFQHLSSRTCWYEKIYDYYSQIAKLMNKTT